jgi:hypothetical protein
MAKLPDNFVKPPPAASRLTTTKPIANKLGRRRKAAEVEAELDAAAAGHVHSVMVRLSAEEHDALSHACTALAVVGHSVSIEDMIKQVLVRWIAATRAMQLPAVPAPSPAPSVAAMPSIRAQLRRIAAEPVRRWHELGQALRRWTHVLGR